MTRAERLNWRMPPLALLKPVQWSTGTKLGVLTLRGYLVISVLLLIVKAVQLAPAAAADRRPRLSRRGFDAGRCPRAGA